MTENGSDTSGRVGGTNERAAPPTSSSSFPSQHDSDDAANDQTTRSSKSKRLTTPFNHFENYFQIKSKANDNNSNDVDTMSQDETTSSTTHTSRNEGEEDAVANQYNHFTAPFKSNNVMMTTNSSRDAPLLSSLSSPFTDYERSQTLDRFAKIFMERMGKAMSSGKLTQAWGRGEGADDDGAYALERDMVKPHITPIVWGSSCVLLTLFSMRCGRWYQQQQLRSLWKRSTGTMNNADATNSATMSTTMRQRHPSLLEDVRQSGMNSRNPNFNNSSSGSSSGGGIDMTVPVDISLSLLFGISTTIFLLDKHRLLHDFAHAPLLEGRSVLTEELCVPFQKEVMANITTVVDDKDATKASDDLWHDENLGEFDSLRAIRDFVVHCHMRERTIEETKSKGP
ncbi:hypothetical protein ACHAWU_002163 [Discostella pseudostelligera]|uniref:Uncharacterized protein n=1 Tax=Discostella pseudostelligera TaxID=259834 RepID=A0ABD3M9L2_9STRA